MSKVGVVLSGCGFKDGAEIQEAVLTLYFLDKAGVEVVCM
ncbi:MAG: isoprenoid biosynthesis protein ElbB, partial [Candidatus Sericytochromatia bacterium]